MPPQPWPAWLLDELNPPPVKSAAWEPTTDQSCLRYRSRYGSAALQHAADRVARAASGARNSTLNSEAFGIARLVATGLLDIQEVADALAAAAIAAGLTPRETLAMAAQCRWRRGGCCDR